MVDNGLLGPVLEEKRSVVINEHAKQVEEVFRRVIEAAPEDRSSFLDGHCDDPEIRAEVEKLLDHDRMHGGLIAEGITPLDGSPRHKVDRATRSLWTDAKRIWDCYEARREFREFVAADYEEVYQALASLRGRVSTFLEWGSGLGVIAIMASRLGFDAYGIESETRLVDWSYQLAERYDSDARFITGSFIPAEYEWSAEEGDESFRSDVDVEPGYIELDMELRDFDLVYVYPWPDELAFCRNIMRRCGGENALFTSYDAREGVSLSRLGLSG